MKKIYILILTFILLLTTGCEKNDLSKYDKIELTEDNIYKYIDIVRLSGSYEGKTVHLEYAFESDNDGYVFENVSFDVNIIDGYEYYILLNTEVSDNIYIDRNRVKLDSEGNSEEFSVTQSVKHEIVDLHSAGSVIYGVKNLKGYVYIPWN